MKIRNLAALAVLPVMAACGGDGDSGNSIDSLLSLDDDSAEFNPDGPVVNAGRSNYYRELVGVYDGQITFTDSSAEDPVPCVWEVEIGVEGDYVTDPEFRQVYDLSMSITSDKLEGR